MSAQLNVCDMAICHILSSLFPDVVILLQVPQFQPGFAQEMFKKFLAGDTF